MPLAPHRLAAFLVKARWYLFATAMLLTGAAWLSPQPVWTRSVESMFAADDPLLLAYRRLQERFAGNQVVMVVFDDPQLMAADGQGVQRLQTLTQALEAAPGVRSALSLSQLNQLLALRPAALFQQMAGGATPAILKTDDPLASDLRKLFQGYTHSADGKTAAVACLLDAQADVQTSVAAIHKIANHPPAGLSPGYLAGEPVMVAEGFTMIERDGRLLAWASSILLSLVILLLFRSLRWVLVALIVVQASLLWTRALAVAMHLRLSLVSSVLGALITVVGVATVIHLIIRIRDARQRGLGPRDALQESLAILIGPIFWACATDALGFGALMLSQVEPVRDFGAMMALGSMMVLVAVAVLTPALALLGFDVGRGAESRRGEVGDQVRHDWLQQILGGLLRRVQRRRRGVLALGGLVALGLGAGAMRLQVETDFTRNFRSDSDLVQAYAWIEQRLGGAGVLDVVITAPEGLNQGFLEDVARVEDALRALRDETGKPLLSKVVSLADAESIARQDRFLGALPLAARWAALQQAMPSFADAMWSSASADKTPVGEVASAQNAQHAALRIMLRAPERQDAQAKKRLIERVEEATQAALAKSQSRAEVTGVFVLLTHLITSLLRDQWICFVAAALGIVLMMAVAFSSVRLGLVALAPNAAPVLITMGVLGWMNIKVNMGAAMISAVSLGLSVDSSIHYLAAYQRARRLHHDVDGALHVAQRTVGSAMVCSTLALVAGFVVLCFSQFIPTAYFGALVSLAMLGGLAGNLIILPLLVAEVE